MSARSWTPVWRWSEIIVAARAFFAGRPSLGDEVLTRAFEADGEDALELWQWRAFLELALERRQR